MNDDVSVISYSFGVYDWLLLHNSSWHAYVYLLYFFYILSLKLDISRSLLRIFMVNHEDTCTRCEKYPSKLDMFSLVYSYLCQLKENHC